MSQNTTEVIYHLQFTAKEVEELKINLKLKMSLIAEMQMNAALQNDFYVVNYCTQHHESLHAMLNKLNAINVCK